MPTICVCSARPPSADMLAAVERLMAGLKLRSTNGKPDVCGARRKRLSFWATGSDACIARVAGGPTSRVAPIPLFHACRRQYPAGPAGALVAHFPASGSLPQRTGGSAPAFQVSRPAQRSLALRPAWSLDHPRRPVPPKCFERCRYLHHPLRLLPAGATVCRAGFAPAEGRCLSTAHGT